MTHLRLVGEDFATSLKVSVPKSAETIARAIAELHLLHGDWSVTLMGLKAAAAKATFAVDDDGFGAEDEGQQRLGAITDQLLEMLGLPNDEPDTAFISVRALANAGIAADCGDEFGPD